MCAHLNSCITRHVTSHDIITAVDAYTAVGDMRCSVSISLSFFTRKINFSTASAVKIRSNWGTKKSKRNVKINVSSIMGNLEIEKVLAPLRASVKEQGDILRKLKERGASELDIKKAVVELKARKKLLEDKELEITPATIYFDRAKMEDVLKRRFFYDQSFSIYGGISGQYDFGPMGCALKTNLLNIWRQFFILHEQMLEVDCSILTPYSVLKASGHVERFADVMVRDIQTGDCFRLDHLIKAHLEKAIKEKDVSTELISQMHSTITQLDGYTKEEMGEILTKYDIRSPLTQNKLSAPMEFNLMFPIEIGPSGVMKGFLRPETAQGIFVNFKRLLEFNQGKIPFAAAQIGNSFRNEISPRSGLLRVREFTMAEIEHFCDPVDKSHHKFPSISQEILTLYSACNQMNGEPAEKIPIGKAIEMGLVANETLAYFMARIHKFLKMIGMDEGRLRFRQHMSNEMAHYACDCWDAECLTSYGWVECVGCADRSAFDLTQHFQATGVKLAVTKTLSQPQMKDVTEIVPNKSAIGKTYKWKSKDIVECLANMCLEDVLKVKNDLDFSGKCHIEISGENYDLGPEMISVKTYAKTSYTEEIVPSVIEPSFGIGRIMYALLEHNFHMREGDEFRTYFSLPPIVAPLKCSILPLSNNDDFKPILREISKHLTNFGISHKVDDSSGSIGKRYTRMDEIAVPFGITVDFDSLETPVSVTLRERDSMLQLRIPVSEVAQVIANLSNGSITWLHLEEQYPKFVQQENTK